MRGLQTAEADAKIDRTLGSFLQLLSPHFLHSAAHKALEFLIRRFEIHKYNMDAVLACVLPYHGTRWFVRMVQLLRLKETCWSWLQGKHGMSPPARATFVARCRKDARVLKQLCLLGLSEAQEPCSRGRVAFTTVVVLEMLSASPSCSEVRAVPRHAHHAHHAHHAYHAHHAHHAHHPYRAHHAYHPLPLHPICRPSCSCCCPTSSGSSRRRCPPTRRPPPR